MNKTPQRNETREHLLATGEQLCLQRGFTGMGLSEMLTLAEVPKGSFYYYFRSKEAFGVALIERYFVHHLDDLERQLSKDEQSQDEPLLNYFRRAERLFREQGHIIGCLGVKLSAEVCDLSEPMRDALQDGAAKIIAAYSQSLRKHQRTPDSTETPEQLAELIYLLWLGASLQSKISREARPLYLALGTIEQWLHHR